VIAPIITTRGLHHPWRRRRASPTGRSAGRPALSVFAGRTRRRSDNEQRKPEDESSDLRRDEPVGRERKESAPVEAAERDRDGAHRRKPQLRDDHELAGLETSAWRACRFEEPDASPDPRCRLGSHRPRRRRRKPAGEVVGETLLRDVVQPEPPGTGLEPAGAIGSSQPFDAVMRRKPGAPLIGR
jgi:hypothetical protein